MASLFKPSRSHVVKTRTAGSYTLTNTTWQYLDTGLDIAIRASVGDDIRIGINALWNNEAQVGKLNVGTWNGTTLVNFVGASTPVGTSVSVDGLSGWFGPPSVYMPLGSAAIYTVVAGDIVVDANLGPQVTLRLLDLVGGTKTLIAVANTPFQWWAENITPAYGSGF